MDPIADMITIIRNGYLAKKQIVYAPYSSVKKIIAEKINKLGYLSEIKVNNKSNKLEITLRYVGNQPALLGIERISKPSLRIYKAANEIPKVLGGKGQIIISTPRGIMSGSEAKKTKSGGELLLKVW